MLPIFNYIVYVEQLYKQAILHIFHKTDEVKKVLLSRNCDGCSQLKSCKKRYEKVKKGEKVYCPDGTAHLVDEEKEQFFLKPQIEIYKNC